jgi:hypothetical protein
MDDDTTTGGNRPTASDALGPLSLDRDGCGVMR